MKQPHAMILGTALWGACMAAGAAEVIAVSGTVERMQGEQATALRAGDRLSGALELRSGSRGMLQLRLDDGSVLTLADAASVKIPAQSQEPLQLVRGSMKLLPAKDYLSVLAGGYLLKTNGLLRLNQCAAPCAEPAGLYGKSLSGEVVVEYGGGRAVIQGKPFYAAAGNHRPTILAREGAALQETAQIQGALDAKAAITEKMAQALKAYQAGDKTAAQSLFTQVLDVSPTERSVPYYLGLIALDQQDNETALRWLQRYTREDPDEARQRNVAQVVTLLVTSQLQTEVQQALRQEKSLVAEKPEPNTVAVQPFTHRGDESYAPMAKGLAAMVITDLSKVPGLKVLERQRVQKLLDEISLNQSGLVSQESQVRAARLMRAEKVVLGSLGVQLIEATGPANPVQERFDLEEAVIDSVTAQALGGMKKSGEIDAFFLAQKELVFHTLVDMGIPLNTLPPAVRKSLERFHTTNMAAFKMFSSGLNAQDKGNFAEAKSYFEKALELDPNFELAGELSVSMPNSNAMTQAQLRMALAAASQTALSSMQTAIGVDLSGALAALQSGLKLALINNPTNQAQSNVVPSTVLPQNYAPRMAVALQYVQGGVEVATGNEWMLSQVVTDAQGLVRAGDSTQLLAARGNAVSSTQAPITLSDGTVVTWGTWNTNPFTVSTNGTAVSNLGPQLQFMYGSATRDMPTTGTGSFSPVGGFFSPTTGNVAVNGNISVNFNTHLMTISNLSFQIGSLDFNNLSGTTTYSGSIASGAFLGNYSGGACANCTAFNPATSTFSGNFLGKGATGILYSTMLNTGSGTVAGSHVFGR